jgi:hypothetical protein
MNLMQFATFRIIDSRYIAQGIVFVSNNMSVLCQILRIRQYPYSWGEDDSLGPYPNPFNGSPSTHPIAVAASGCSIL